MKGEILACSKRILSQGIKINYSNIKNGNLREELKKSEEEKSKLTAFSKDIIQLKDDEISVAKFQEMKNMESMELK